MVISIISNNDLSRRERAIFVELMTKNDKLSYGSLRKYANSFNYNELKKCVCGMKFAVIYNRI